MTVRKLNTGKWLCECYPQGRDKRRIRKSFPIKGEAVGYEQYVMNETASRPWVIEKTDKRSLLELAQLWYALHGQTLSSGLIVFRKLKLIANALGNPRAVVFTANDFAQYRKQRSSGDIYLYKRFPYGVSDTTLNMDHSHHRPKGQMTHVLRHTFAAHFMMNDGNILVLPKILGHHDISMTMRYAHFAPEHSETAVKLNPLAMAQNGGELAAEATPH